MAKRRAFTMFLMAAVLAVAAAWIANNWIQSRIEPKAELATTPVVVAALKIPFGQKIEGAHVKVVQMPEGTYPDGVFHDPEAVLGRVAKQAMLPGEMLIDQRVVEQLGGSTLSAIVTPDKRAVTVRVNDVVGVAGFLLPGNRVDVLATRKERNRATTRTILEDLKVLAVDQTASPEKDKPVIVRAVTLEASPEEVETLVKATNEGPVQLTLRNPTDDRQVVKAEEPTQPVASVRRPPRRVRQAAYSVTVIRGTEVATAKAKI